MTDPLDAFLAWSLRARASLPATTTANVVRSDDMIYLDIEENNGAIGRLTFWKNGEADASVYDPNGELIDLREPIKEAGGWDCVKNSELDRAFSPFMAQFLCAEL